MLELYENAMLDKGLLHILRFSRIKWVLVLKAWIIDNVMCDLSFVEERVEFKDRLKMPCARRVCFCESYMKIGFVAEC